MLFYSSFLTTLQNKLLHIRWAVRSCNIALTPFHIQFNSWLWKFFKHLRHKKARINAFTIEKWAKINNRSFLQFKNFYVLLLNKVEMRQRSWGVGFKCSTILFFSKISTLLFQLTQFSSHFSNIIRSSTKRNSLKAKQSSSSAHLFLFNCSFGVRNEEEREGNPFFVWLVGINVLRLFRLWRMRKFRFRWPFFDFLERVWVQVWERKFKDLKGKYWEFLDKKSRIFVAFLDVFCETYVNWS